MILIPKDWASFQHYKQRRPPWIKLHRTLLDNYDFQRLPDASRALAPCLWLLASEYQDGKIDASLTELAFRLRKSEQEVAEALQPLLEAKFFDVASGMLAPCKQDAMPETEERQRQRREETAPNGASSRVYFFDQPPIRLSEKDYRKWESAFPRLDLAAELTALAGWAGDQRDWFHAVSGALAKRNRQQKQISENAARGVTVLTPSGNPWPEGIT